MGPILAQRGPDPDSGGVVMSWAWLWVPDGDQSPAGRWVETQITHWTMDSHGWWATARFIAGGGTQIDIVHAWRLRQRTTTRGAAEGHPAEGGVSEAAR